MLHRNAAYTVIALAFTTSAAFAETDESTQKQVLMDGCAAAGRTATECTCYVNVLHREMTPEEIAFYVDVVSRQKKAQEDPEAAAALMEDINNRRDYYRQNLAPANKAAQIAMKECAK